MENGLDTDSSLQGDGAIRIVILAETRFYREGLAQALGRERSMRIVATAAPGDEVLTNVTTDLILIDMAMSGGPLALRTIVGAAAGARVVALGVAESEDDVLRCAEAGVSGYVPRDASLQDLVMMLESVSRGEAICSPRVAGSLLRRIAKLAAGQPAGLPEGQLTGREREIIPFIDRGLSNKEIARSLGIEVATVKNHVHNILEKLGVHRRGQAAARLRAIPLGPARSAAV